MLGGVKMGLGSTGKLGRAWHQCMGGAWVGAHHYSQPQPHALTHAPPIFVHGSSLMDRISTKIIFKETNLLSVNQINAQIKLLEVWKSKNYDSYPIQWPNRKDQINREGLKSSNKPDLVIKGKSFLQSLTFINDAANVWNGAPSAIKDCTSLSSVKKTD